MADLEGAVLDAPVLDTLDDQQIDDQGADDGAVDDSDDAALDVAGEGIKGDERTLPRWIRDLKESRPADFRAAKDSFFEQKGLQEKLKDFDLDGVKSFLEEHGGRESLATTLTEMQAAKAELEGLNQAIASGDKAIIAQVAEANPEAFPQMAREALNQWSARDPEGYSHAISGVIAQTFGQAYTTSLFSDAPASMHNLMAEARAALQYAPPEQQGKIASAVIARLEQFMGGFQQSAAKPVAQQQKPDAKLNEREQGVAAGEQRLFDQDLGRDVNGFRDPLITKELATFFSRRPEDADAKELAIGQVRSKVIARMAADTGFQKSLNQLTARRDKDGALRLIKSRETSAIQEIAPKVGRMIFGNPGPVKVEKKSDEQRLQRRVIAPAADIDPRDSILARAFAR